MLERPEETQSVWPPSSIEHTLWDGGGLTVPDEDIIQLSANIKDQRLTTAVICQVETGRKDPPPPSVWSCSWMFEFEYWVLRESFSGSFIPQSPCAVKRRVLGSFRFSSTPTPILNSTCRKHGQDNLVTSLFSYICFQFESFHNMAFRPFAVVTFLATQGGAIEGYPTSDPTLALGKDTDTESEWDRLGSHHRVKLETC